MELPSQLNERWLLDRELLDRFARHYQTGEPMPQALVEKIERASKFNQGYSTLEYLSAAIVDMDLHMRPDGVDDIAAFEQRGARTRRRHAARSRVAPSPAALRSSVRQRHGTPPATTATSGRT